MKKILVVSVMLLGFIQVHCFGRFAIVRKVYQFIDEITFAGTPLLVKFVKSAITWLIFIVPIVGGIAFAADFLVINLIEFWTGENIVDGHKDGSKSESSKSEEKSTSQSIKAGKTIAFQSAENGMKLVISRSENGKELRMSSIYNGETREMIAFQDEPGKLYKVNGDNLEPIEMTMDELGNLRGITVGSETVPMANF